MAELSYGWPGGLGLVADPVIVVPLGPLCGGQARDPAFRGQLEPARAGEPVVDLGEVPVRPVRVRAVLDGAVAGGPDRLPGEAPQVIVRMVDRQVLADASDGLAARLVEPEAHLPAGGVEQGAAVARTRRSGRTSSRVAKVDLVRG
ncbi:hypothetical protein AB0C90_35235 [Streptomyces sp. NPDC048550]|uniref:hypothetical protein n=1 Tax=Streptomyces sp. NPDC048550 TaxID=3155739 RepID=UPI00343D96E1